tara:strand:- start:500 stop:877 length:378 start_codon:yes stop_codon:yes gene_type:complete
MEALLPVLDFALPVLGVILTIVLVALAKKHIGKLGIENSATTDAMLEKYVPMAVSFAEGMGRKAIAAGQAKMPGESKKTLAVKTVLAELEQSGVKNVAEDLISARIEAWLEDKPGKSSGEDSTTA